LRDTEPGVISPEIRKNRPMVNRAAAITTVDSATLVTSANWASWMSW
jgi:hypothetical protein